MRRRNKQVKVRMTEEEYQYYKERLNDSQLTGNFYGIKCLLTHPIYAIGGLQELIRQLKAIGNNLNQISKLLHCKQDSFIIKNELSELIKEVKQGTKQIWQLLKSLKVVKV